MERVNREEGKGSETAMRIGVHIAAHFLSVQAMLSIAHRLLIYFVSCFSFRAQQYGLTKN